MEEKREEPVSSIEELNLHLASPDPAVEVLDPTQSIWPYDEAGTRSHPFQLAVFGQPSSSENAGKQKQTDQHN